MIKYCYITCTMKLHSLKRGKYLHIDCAEDKRKRVTERLCCDTLNIHAVPHTCQKFFTGFTQARISSQFHL